MPIFLDRHDLTGLTASDIAEAHRKDLEVQGKYGVRFLTYWFDESNGTGFCLIDAPDIETAIRVHDEAHGDVAKDVIEVDLSAVHAFLGRVSDPEPIGGADKVKFDSALRAIMFTDIVGSTSMTERLGDARSVEMVRAHDALVRRALKEKNGRVVKHTGDGIMASFDDAMASVLKTTDANDVLYQIEASHDYDPGPALEKIRAPLLAINSADDLINPPELGILEREITRVPKGRAVVIPFSSDTRGHGTHTIATVWKTYLEELLKLTAR